MGIRTNHVCMDECRTESITAIFHCTPERSIARHRVSAIDLFEMEVGKSRYKSRDAAARSLHFDRHRDCITVIFHTENDGQLSERGGVHRLPEFAFARCAIAQRNVSDFVSLGRDLLEVAIITSAGRYACCLR